MSIAVPILEAMRSSTGMGVSPRDDGRAGSTVTVQTAIEESLGKDYSIRTLSGRGACHESVWVRVVQITLGLCGRDFDGKSWHRV